MRWCIYLDMDAFYVSCELKRHPELRGKPVAVSADPRGGKGRGVVLSASYEARKFGLRSALPVSQAYALCPSYVWIRPDFSFYEENSRSVMALLKQRTAEARVFSIDEAAYPFEAATPHEVEVEGLALQREVRTQFDLPSSIGIGPTLTVAKIASDRAKPGGVVVVPPDSLRAFLAPLPVRSVPGIGQVTETALGSVGVRTMGDMAVTSVDRLRRALGGLAAPMHDLACGVVREEPWPEEEGPRSLGTMSTFDVDASEASDVREELHRLCGSLSESVAKQGRRFRTVTLRLRTSDFQQLQRSRTLPHRTESAEVLGRTATMLLDQLLGEMEERARARPGSLADPGAVPRAEARAWGIRTVGISVSDLDEGSASQRSLDAFGDEGAPRTGRTGS